MKVLRALIISGCVGLSACTFLTAEERHQVKYLQSKGITVANPQSEWEKPASPILAGFLNVLPGMGNFYLALGDGADRMQFIYGAFNIFMWPWSVVWGVPEAAIDATTINKRELIYHYKYDRKSPVFNQHFDYNRQHNSINTQRNNYDRQYDDYNSQQYNNQRYDYNRQYNGYNNQRYDDNRQYNDYNNQQYNNQHYDYNRQYNGYNNQRYDNNNQYYNYNRQRYNYNYRHHDSDYSDYQYFNSNQ